LNCRHADFQSAALPTELPGHLHKGDFAGLPIGDQLAAGNPSFAARIRKLFSLAGPAFGWFIRLLGGNRIMPAQPTVEIDLAAARRTERMMLGFRRLFANRARLALGKGDNLRHHTQSPEGGAAIQRCWTGKPAPCNKDTVSFKGRPITPECEPDKWRTKASARPWTA
jgi:hypothetical protein